MARTISDIQTQIQNILVDELAKAGVVVDPATWSATNILRLLCYVFAFCANVLETIFDTFSTDVTSYIANWKPGTAAWYANMFLAYQHGFSLLPESDQYDNTGYTDDQIAASKVIAYAAVQETTDSYGRVSLRIKVAGTDGTDLNKLPDEQLAGAVEYGNRIKYAGVPLDVTSGDPDSVKMSWTIYYDPLILNNSGNRLDGSAQDVIGTAIRGYLRQLPFNGTFVPQYLQDAIQAVPGVVIAIPQLLQVKYADFDWQNVGVTYVPDSGYLRINSAGDLAIQYVAQSSIK